MKTASLLPIIILLLTINASSLFGQSTGFKLQPVINGSGEDVQGIKNTLEHLYGALAERDAKAYAAQTAPGYYVLEQGEYWDLEYTLHRIGNSKPEGYTRKDSLDYKIIEVLGDTAFVVWDLSAEVNNNGTVTHYQWLESGTLKKIDGVWKMHILHSTRVEKH